MDIYILRDGNKIGPFSEASARALIQQGDVAEEDMACRQGASTWEPLGKVLGTPAATCSGALPSVAHAPQSDAETAPLQPGAPPPALGIRHSSFVITPPPPPIDPPPDAETAPLHCSGALPSAEPATAAQIAFLSYFGIPIPVGLLEEVANKLVSGAVADPKNARRLALWQVDRLRLHHDLFAAEAQAKKENRAHFFFDLCETAGADYFTGVTKAHCQVLVTFLDVKYPRWDVKDAEATERYFFPAIAEKFPQLVNKPWRGRFRYGEGMMAPGARAARKSPTAKLANPSDSPLRAIARGVVLGLCILGILYAVHHMVHGGKWPLPALGKGAAAAAVEAFAARHAPLQVGTHLRGVQDISERCPYLNPLGGPFGHA